MKPALVMLVAIFVMGVVVPILATLIGRDAGDR